MSAIDDVEYGVFERLSGDAGLTAILGPSRVNLGWPSKLLSAPVSDAFPRVTYFAIEHPDTVPDTVPVQIDEWVWPDGASGGLDALQAIDDRVVALLQPAPFDTPRGARLYPWRLTGRTWPGDTTQAPLRRTRRCWVDILRKE